MLEETGLPYEPHLVDFDTNDQASPEFRSLNPYGKIPAILDPERTRRAARCRCSSPARFSSTSPKDRAVPAAGCRARATRRCSGSCSRWAASARCSARWVSSTSSPARTTRTSARATATWPKRAACSRCSRRVSPSRAWLMGEDYTIADIAIFPWVRNLVGFYGAGELVGFGEFAQVGARSRASSRARRSRAA